MSDVSLDHRLSVAPMMACTDRHARYFLRQLSRHTLLYTEMITTGALLHGDVARHLRFHAEEHPVAAQLGGAEPEAMAECALLVQHWGYDEININCGCPSDRVQSGCFGAALMAEPGRVADCVAAMREVVNIPVTVKCRIGVDHRDRYEDLTDFVTRIAAAGCGTFIVHARKAWLQGLSPRQNREIPPLRHDVVYRLAADFPHLEFILNGGLQDLGDVCAQFDRVAGAMLGRAAYANPYLLADADAQVFGAERAAPSRADVVRQMLPYVEGELASGTRLAHVARHLLGLYQGVPGARHWRRHLSQHMHDAGAGTTVLLRALDAVEAAARGVGTRASRTQGSASACVAGTRAG